MKDCVISGNTSDDGGGVVFYHGKNLVIQDTLISGNQATYNAAGLYLLTDETNPTATTTIERTTITGNQAGKTGGGISAPFLLDDPLTIRQSTISGNTAADGAGVYFYSIQSAVVIENSTISGNTATGTGGGLYLFKSLGAAGTFNIQNSTIAANSAATAGGVFFKYQVNASDLNPIIVRNSIIGDNTAATGPDLSTGVAPGPGTFAGRFRLLYSLVEAPGAANVTNEVGNQLGVDPLLRPLANNGGETETHMPRWNSPAVNAGDPAFAPPPSVDQRGLPASTTGVSTAARSRRGFLQPPADHPARGHIRRARLPAWLAWLFQLRL